MKVGVIQSNYIPWRGYFDMIASADLFVFHDDLQYTKGDWRNRNRIKTAQGSKWITVPVSYKRVSQLICETEINNVTDWWRNHLNQWQAHYSKAPYFEDVLCLLNQFRLNEDLTISQLNIRLIRAICAYLGIETPMVMSSELNLCGAKTARLIDLLRKTGGTSYLSGPNGDNYLDKELFRKEGLSLYYKTYDYEPYPQLWGPFDGAVSILDLIANCGPQAKTSMRSTTPDKVIC
jgi:hypothetical protein